MNASFRRMAAFFQALLTVSVLFLQPIGSMAAAPESLANDRNVRQVLNRITFGARPGDFDAVKKIGVNAFIEKQLDPFSIDDSATDKMLQRLPTLNLSNIALAEQYNPPKPAPTPWPSPDPKTVAKADAKPGDVKTEEKTSIEPTPTPSPSPNGTPKPTPTPKNPYMVVTELQRARVLRAVYSERQLYEMTVDFWENHFSIYNNKDADRWMLTSFDRDDIRPFAMGRFRDLLEATAKSPAMLYYLDNWTSTVYRTYPATKTKPETHSGGVNENYARELMELHTLGVDGGYTQKDVQEVARCFTGWTIRKPNEEGIFIYDPARHDQGEKTVLGVKIPAGGGIADGERVLDILASHPSTAKFITTKLARRFLGDDPPQSAITRASKVFLQTGGNITEVLRSLLEGPEFLTAANYRTKVRSPFEFVVASLRATNAQTDGTKPVLDWIARMGQPVLARLTPDGYPDRADKWLSNNDMIARLNFAAALATNKIQGTKIDAKKLFPDASDPASVTRVISGSVLMDDVSESTEQALAKIAVREAERKKAPATTTPVTNADMVKPDAAVPQFNGDYVAEVLALTLGSPDFQKR